MIRTAFRLCLLSCCLLGATLGTAQVSFDASSTARIVEQGGIVSVFFELSGARGQSFTPPTFNGFRVVGGPNVANTYTIINGSSSSTERYGFDLLAEKAGEFEIGSASIKVNGKSFSTKPLKLLVRPVDLKTKGQALDKDAIASIRIVPEKDTVYVGEELPIRIDLLSQKQLYSYEMRSGLSLPDFRAEQLRRFNSLDRIEEAKGLKYSVKTIERYAAYAIKPGSYEVGPVASRVYIVQEGARRGFFGRLPTQGYDVTSQVEEVTVLPLPGNAPADFTGAVGSWRFYGQFEDTDQVTTADAVTFKLFIQGRGDVTRIFAPELKWPDGWKAYPAESSLEQAVESDTGAVYTRVYDYTVVPTRGGTFRLAPTASFFDPESQEYITWRGSQVTVEVKDVGTSSDLSEGVNTERQLVFYKGKPHVLRESAISSSLRWILLGVGPLLLLMSWITKALYTDKKQATRLSAKLDPVAEGRRRLQAARATLGEPAKFYAEVRVALERYAEERLGLSPRDQSRESILAAFLAKQGASLANGEQIARENAERFLEARALADRGLYGGGTDEAGRQQALQELERLLSV